MPCLNGGTCVDKVNGFTCNCTEDYMGVLCDRPFEVCEMKPCKNNGTCTSIGNNRDFSCECYPGKKFTKFNFINITIQCI